MRFTRIVLSLVDDVAYWLCLIVQRWILVMSGVVSVAIGVWENIHGGFSAPYWWIAGTMFVLAMFLVWRDMYKEARPYDSAHLSHGRSRFAEILDEDKSVLEQLAIAKDMPYSPALQRLEASGWAAHSYTTGRFNLNPHLAPIVPRLISEWRRSQPTA
jgi:hypothetical protein